LPPSDPHADEDLLSPQEGLDVPSCDEGFPDDDPTSDGSVNKDIIDDQPASLLLRRSARLYRISRDAAYGYAVSVATALHIRAANVSAIAEVFNATATAVPPELGDAGSNPGPFSS
jgi:hypothetical protein